MDADGADRMDALMAERADRPFGDTDLVTGRALQPFSMAGQAAADNLLTKALRALAQGDEVRARAYVDRACRLPFDRHEETQPAAAEASMLLFLAITDELEGCDVDDDSWLAAARAAAAVVDEVGRQELWVLLRVIDQDYNLSKVERRALRTAIEELPPGAELRDRTLSPDELGDSVMSVLKAVRAYEAALDALA